MSRYYAIRRGDGGFVSSRILNNDYRDLVVGESLDEVKRAVVKMWLLRLPGRAVRGVLRRLSRRVSPWLSDRLRAAVDARVGSWKL
jgi:hypothetical protein